MSEKWNEIRKTGILVFLLSLPVIIWRSGKLGRLITIFSTTLVLLWAVGKTSDAVFSQIINKWEIRHESNKLFSELGKTKEGIDSVNSFVRNADALLRKELDKKVESYFGELRERYSKIEESIKQLESGIRVVSERERVELKERIIELKEQMILGQKSVNSKTQRLQFETILSNISLLNGEEKSRFMKDLIEAGFFVESAKKQVRAVGQGMMATSCDITSVMFAPRSMLVSSDSMIPIQYEEE